MEHREHSECLVCKSSNIKALKGYEKHDLVRCKNCGFVFMKKIPTLEELDNYYSNYSYNLDLYLSSITIKRYNLLLDEFENFRKTNRMLEIGCGRGLFLLEAKKRGWIVQGTEFSKTAAQICIDNGIPIKEGVLDPQKFDVADFDIITSFEVMEHINNPNEELDSINKLLRKGGLFYCTTPNFNSLLRYYLKSAYDVITYPEHLSYYTKSTLSRLICSKGFKVYKFLSTGISITRIRNSAKKPNSGIIKEVSADEHLRQNIEAKWYWGIAKRAVNFLLTLTNTGMTLKGYYVKT